MKKLKALTTHLINAGLAKASAMDSWIEGGLFKPTAKDVGTGLLILHFEYKSVISLENFSGNAALLAAQVAVWMHENANTDDGDDPEVSFDADKNDSGLFDVELETHFSEPIQIIESANGPLMLNGKRYDIGDAEIWTAEEFSLDVNGQVEAEQ